MRPFASFLAILIATALSSASAVEAPVVKSELKVGAFGGFPVALPESARFGWGLEPLGDFDGDGIPDLVVTMHGDDDGDVDAGALWIALLATDGSVREVRKISAEEGGFAGPLAAADAFGWSVAAIGDVDQDGVTDLAVGAIGDDDCGPQCGAVYILLLNAQGGVRRQQKISPREAWTRQRPWSWILPERIQGGFRDPLGPNDMFGVSVEGIGDLDGDGIPDLAVGARLDNDADERRGALWILFLDADGTVKRSSRIATDAGGFGGELQAGDEFGFALAALGDLDGDGVVDLAVSARHDADGGRRVGAVWVLFLAEDGTVKKAQKISPRSGGLMVRLNNGSEFGVALASIPGAKGARGATLAVGARGDSRAGYDTGAVWLLSLDGSGKVVGERRIGVNDGGFAGTLEPRDWFGVGLAAIGDLDGDGMVDLAVGAEGDDDGGEATGAVWMLLLNPLD